MPQLVKGGKYVFGWSYVHPDGRIMIPPEALDEYGFAPGEKLIVMNGSTTSKGFALTNHRHLQNTPFGSMVSQIPEIDQFRELKNGFVSYRDRTFTWTVLETGGCIRISPGILARYSIQPGDRILAGRGSGHALAFIRQGRIIEEAVNHPELTLFK